MQRMALPVVLTAEGTTYDRTRAFIKVCSAQSLLCSSLNLVRLSVALNGKQIYCACCHILCFGILWPHCAPVCRTKRSSYLPTLEPVGPLDLC